MATAHHLHPLVLLPGQGQHLWRQHLHQPQPRPFSARQPGHPGIAPPVPQVLPGWKPLCRPLQERAREKGQEVSGVQASTAWNNLRMQDISPQLSMKPVFSAFTDLDPFKATPPPSLPLLPSLLRKHPPPATEDSDHSPPVLPSSPTALPQLPFELLFIFRADTVIIFLHFSA